MVGCKQGWCEGTCAIEKTKSFKQIKNIENSFLAVDDIEYGYKNKIPLWLFGFVY